MTHTVDYLETQDRHSYDQALDGAAELKQTNQYLKNRMQDARDWQTIRGCP